MKQIIILNGPPQCGKDELANHLVANYPNFKKAKFADELKKMTHRAYNTTNQAADAFEHVKDIPNVEFFGLTPRQAYIGFSENFIKKMHGKDFFGLLLASHIQTRHQKEDDVFIISDGGFSEEVEPLIKTFGAKMITIVRLSREGSDFAASGDSRRYIYAEQFSEQAPNFTDLANTGSTVEEYLKEATQALKEKVPLIFDSLLTYSASMC